MPLVPESSPSCGGDVTVYARHKLTELVYFVLHFLCLFLSLWPFRLHFIAYILPTTLRVLTLFFRSYLCLIGPFNYMPLYESLLQP